MEDEMKCPKCGAEINVGRLLGSRPKRYSGDELAKRSERMRAAQAKRAEAQRDAKNKPKGG